MAHWNYYRTMNQKTNYHWVDIAWLPHHWVLAFSQRISKTSLVQRYLNCSEMLLSCWLKNWETNKYSCSKKSVFPSPLLVKVPEPTHTGLLSHGFPIGTFFLNNWVVDLIWLNFQNGCKKFWSSMSQCFSIYFFLAKVYLKEKSTMFFTKMWPHAHLF